MQNTASIADFVPSAPERTATVSRAVTRFCGINAWTPLVEVPLPGGRRADILALLPDSRFAVIEVKSCARDFQSDNKWPDYRAWCDRFYFAVDVDFPQALLPEDAGLVVADGAGATLLREAPVHPLAPARRRALLLRFAQVAGARLSALSDPEGTAILRAALRVE